MRRDIAEWIDKDPERRRVYETDPVYHAQAQMLSSMLDAVESSLRLHEAGFGRVVIESAVQSAVLAVLGSIEAAGVRIRDMRRAVVGVEMGPGDWLKALFPDGDWIAD